MLFKNLALGIVLTAPSPATSGTILGLQSGNVSRFPDSDTTEPYFCTICPSNADPNPSNSEIIKVTSDNTGTNLMTIVRAQRGSSARSIAVGDRIFLGIYKEELDVLNDGWIPILDTCTYSSADDPTYLFTIAGDKTTKYYPGMRIKLTQATGGTKYFIITKVVYSAPNTVITVYGGTDYDLNNEAISSPYFSLVKVPVGFPLNITKWMVEVKTNNSYEQAPPIGTAWYNLGSLSITIPIGIWIVEYFATVFGSNGAGNADCHIALSDSPTTNSDVELFTQMYSIENAFQTSITRKKYLNLTTKTPYYLNARSTNGGSVIRFDGSSGTTVIRATSAYF